MPFAYLCSGESVLGGHHRLLSSLQASSRTSQSPKYTGHHSRYLVLFVKNDSFLAIVKSQIAYENTRSVVAALSLYLPVKSALYVQSSFTRPFPFYSCQAFSLVLLRFHEECHIAQHDGYEYQIVSGPNAELTRYRRRRDTVDDIVANN